MLKMERKRVKDLVSIIIMVTVATYYIFCTKSSSELNGDLGDGAFSIIYAISNIIKSGEIPLWLSNIWGGIPAVGSTLTQALYPVNWLGFWIFGKDMSYWFIAFDFIFHISILCIGLYIFLKINLYEWYIALLSTLLTVFCGAVLWQREWIYLFMGFVWLPFMVDCVILFERENGKKKWIYIILGSISMGMSGLANQGQTLLINILIVCWLYLCYVIKHIDSWTYIWKLTYKMLLFGIIGICICAPSLLPAIEYTKNASRYIPDIESGWVNGMEVMPLEIFVKHVTSIGDVGSILQLPSKYVGEGYRFGNVPFLVSFFGCIGFFRKTNWDSIKIFIRGLFIFLLCYCTGLIFPYLFYYIPYYNAIREPFLYQPYMVLVFVFYVGEGIKSRELVKKSTIKAEFFMPVIMCGLLLVIIMANILPCYYNEKVILLECILFIILMLITVNIKYKKRILQILIFNFIIIEILLQLHISFSNLQNLYTYKEANNKIQQVIQNTKELAFMQESKEEHSRHYNFGTNAYPSNTSCLIDTYDAFGYFNPVPRSNRLANQMSWQQQAVARNIKYWHTLADSSSWFYEFMASLGYEYKGEVEGFPTLDAANTEKTTLWVAETLGTAWMVYDVIMTNKMEDKTDEEILYDLEYIGMDIKNKAYVNGLEKWETVPGENSIYHINLLEYNNNNFKLDVTTNQDGILVTSETWYPGWNVFIDGKKQDILQVNYCFKGVMVSEGTHIIEFKYEPISFFVGVCLCAGAIIICFIIGFYNIIIKK